MKVLANRRQYEGMAGAWLIVVRGNKVLAARRAPPCKEDVGKWNFIGGGVDDTDPSPKHAAVREFKEECGIDMLGYWDFIEPLLSVYNQVTGGTCHFFVLELAEDELDITLNEEHDAVGWFNLAGTPNSLLSSLDSLNWPTAVCLVPLRAHLRGG